jgi:hypothetical protein
MRAEVLISTFESVALLLGLGVLGLWVIGRRILPKEALGVLSILALDIALPCLVFVNILVNFKPLAFQGWWLLPLWWCGFTLFLGIMTVLISLLSGPATRREFRVTLFFQNAIFFPLAILTGMFGGGSSHVVELFFFVLFFPSLFFSTAHLFLGDTNRSLHWGKILNRVLLATVAGTALRLAGWEGLIPGFAVAGLRMVGDTALPLLLLILGGNMYVDFKDKGRFYPVEVAKFVLAKNILLPVATLGMLMLVRPPYPVALLMILEAAVPPLTAVPIMVGRAGGNRHLVNQFMFTSFAVSLVSIPLMMGLFAVCFPER